MIALWRDGHYVFTEQPISAESRNEVDAFGGCWVKLNSVMFFEEADAILFFLRYRGERSALDLQRIIVFEPSVVSVTANLILGRSSLWVEDPDRMIVGCYESSISDVITFNCTATKTGQYRLCCNKEAGILRATMATSTLPS